MHVLITGVGGFIGSAMARACLDAGWRVTGVGRKRLPAGLAPQPNLDIVSTDLRHCEGLPNRYDYLVHCAAEVPAYCPDETELYRSNVDGTRKLLDQAAAAGATRVAYMSSMAAYGAVATPIVNEETSPIQPGTYGKSKAEGESLLAAWVARTGGAGVSIRLPGIVGAISANNFLSDTLKNILANRPVTGRKPDALFNNIVHVDDLARFIISLAEKMPTGHTMLTIAASQPIPIRDVLTRLYAASARPQNIRWAPAAGTPFLIEFKRAAALGFRPATVIDSLDRFVTDVLAHESQH